MNGPIKRKIEKKEKWRKTPGWVINLTLKTLLSYKDANRVVSEKLGTREQGTITMNLLLINIIAGKPGIL